MSEAVVRKKQGETVTLRCTYTDADGNPVDLTGATVLSQARNGDEVINFDVNESEFADGVFTLSYDIASDETVGQWKTDILVSLSGVVVISETYTLLIREAQTIAA